MISTTIPMFDIALDFDGEPTTGLNGFNLVFNEDMIKQHARNLLLTNFMPTKYKNQPNDESTGLIIQQDISDILAVDPLIAAFGFIPIVEVYPTGPDSLKFTVALNEADTRNYIDIGDIPFLNIREGTLVGHGEYALDTNVYDVTRQVLRYERFRVYKQTSEIVLCHKVADPTGVLIVRAEDILGFENGEPILPGATLSGEITLDPFRKNVYLGDAVPEVEGYSVTGVTVTLPGDAGVLPSSSYKLVANHLVFDFDQITYVGTASVSLTATQTITGIAGYDETIGAYVPDINAHERTNTRYRIRTGTPLRPGNYMVVYQSYEVA